MLEEEEEEEEEKEEQKKGQRARKEIECDAADSPRCYTSHTHYYPIQHVHSNQL